MTEQITHIQTNTLQLLRATGIALAAAAAILLTTVFPAEYGIDPTGIGKALGLTALHAPDEVAATATGNKPVAAATGVAVLTEPTDAVVRQVGPFQNGEMSLTLQPNEGAEIKTKMLAGQSIVFSWSTNGGPVNFDMHGERPDAGDEFSSYWKDRAKSEAHGSFVAPFDGSHGWYWKNSGTAPVTVTVKLSGYYQKLYRPA